MNYITIAMLIKREGSISQAHTWLIREGISVAYLTLWRWSHKMNKPSPAMATLLRERGVIS